MVVFNVVLPIATYIILAGSGMGHAEAYVASAVWPLAYLVAGLVRTRKVNGISVLSLVLTLVGAATALLSGSLKVTFAEHGVVNIVFGFILLGSLPTSKPLMFYIARSLAAAGNPKKADELDGLLRYPSFRQTIHTITAVWGVAYLVQGLLVLVLTLLLPTATMIKVSYLLPITVTTVVVTWTLHYAKRRRAERETEQARMSNSVGTV